MAVLKQWLSPAVWLPESARLFLRNRARELFGLGLIAAGIFAALSLASWHAGDPSLNRASANAPQNWMGLEGAITADLLYQMAGLGALLLVLPPVLWGARMLRHDETTAPYWRVAAWAAAALLASLALSLLPAPAIWPLPSSLGGAAGDMLGVATAGNLSWALGETIAAGFVALVAGVFAIALFFFAADIRGEHVEALQDRWAEWREARAFSKAAKRKAAPAKGAKPSVKRADAAHRTARPDVEPSRLRVLFYSLSDHASDLGDRLLRRGEYGPVSDEEKEWARSGLLGGFGKRGAEEEFYDDEEEDDEALYCAEEDDEAYDEGPRRPVKVSRSAPRIKPSKRVAREAQPSLKFAAEDFNLPALSLLTAPKRPAADEVMTDEALEQNARLLEGVLDDFGIRGEIINVRPGPVVTLYELRPAPGIKSSRVIALADDIARSMSAVSARVAVVPGRNVIGIELPNTKRETVLLRELLAAADYENTKAKLPLTLGKNIGGEPIIADLSRMPHLLIAGTTGSGKSVGINAMILSILYRFSPEDCKLIMIDPKMLELSVYDGIPHLLSPVVTDPKKAVVALKWVVKEMEDRYRKMSKLGVRNIEGYNVRAREVEESGEIITRTVQTGFDRETGEAIYEEEEMTLEQMPFIVVVIDEMADLMMVAGKEIEGAVQRLAQMARAAGIHMITATQRPSVDVITGTIKANFPTRISFQVTSKIDSRTILGEQGAEQLLGQGDMLYMAGGGRISRVHGPFVSDEEVEKVVKFLKKQGVPEYLDAITAEVEDGGDPFSLTGEGGGSGDDLYDQAVAIVGRDKRASTSYIQRRLQIGYNRAARLIERMEEEGVVSGPNHAGKREVLIGEPGEGVRY
ncbi:DNA translocase FtsK 4TM domain-containing protein [Tepidicaulis sp. LMO-SS28]|uniref:FtsK/SpoIIIE family DNA translocase n=1 Tax=Tepidicaulis sp. LMO-SS28 TaxID=3447455 RepID=UPI003EDEB366